LYDATIGGGFPDDVLSRFLQQLGRHGLLEPHHYTGVHLSVSEVLALAELAGVEGLSQQQLGESLGLEKSTVSRLAAGLEERGWIARERDPANRRFYRLGLTPAGRDVAHRVGGALREHHAKLFAGLTPEERAGLATGLAGLLRVIGELAAQGPPKGHATGRPATGAPESS
jgi:DNA-binding MarR family transcriptional regulator